MARPAPSRAGLARRPQVVLVCPFSLGRASGTPLRARATLEALRESIDVVALATSAHEGALMLESVLTRDQRQLSILRFWRAAFRHLLTLRPRVVHAVTPVGAVPALAARRVVRGMRVVVEFHGAAEHELALSPTRVRRAFAALDRIVAPRADGLVAMSTHQAAWLRDRCGARAPAVVSWGPVDVARLPLEPPAPARPRRFLYTGNANHWQGLDVLVEAARRCDPREMRLTVVGATGEDLGQAADTIDVRGRVSREEAEAAVRASDVVVSPRRGGPVSDLQYPHKLSTYLAAGRAVLATDVSDQGRIVRTARCGLVVAPDDPAALAEGIRSLALRSDAELVAMGVSARSFADRCLSYGELRRRLARAYGVPLR